MCCTMFLEKTCYVSPTDIVLNKHTANIKQQLAQGIGDLAGQTTKFPIRVTLI